MNIKQDDYITMLRSVIFMIKSNDIDNCIKELETRLSAAEYEREKTHYKQIVYSSLQAAYKEKNYKKYNALKRLYTNIKIDSDGENLNSIAILNELKNIHLKYK